MTTGELVRCPPHFRTIKIGVFCHFAVVAQKSFPTQIYVQKLVGGVWVTFLFFSPCASKKRDCSIFSDLEWSSGVRHRNSADSAEIRGFGVLPLSETGSM